MQAISSEKVRGLLKSGKRKRRSYGNGRLRALCTALPLRLAYTEDKVLLSEYKKFLERKLPLTSLLMILLSLKYRLRIDCFVCFAPIAETVDMICNLLQCSLRCKKPSE